MEMVKGPAHSLWRPPFIFAGFEHDPFTLTAKSEEELKSLLMTMKEESGKSWLKAQDSENKDHGI